MVEKIVEVQMITRQQWNAKPPKQPLTPLGKVSNLFIHHSVTNPTGDPKADTRHIQNIHQGSSGYIDIAYTLMVHPDGTVLEGRVINNKAAVGGHTLNWNSKSIAICAIGNYETNAVPDKLIEGINTAFAYAVDNGWVIPNPTIRPHSDVFATACCGKNLKARLKDIKYVGGSTPPAQPNKGYEVATYYTKVNVTLGSDGKGQFQTATPCGPSARLLACVPSVGFQGYDYGVGDVKLVASGYTEKADGGISGYLAGGKPGAKADYHILVTYQT